MDLRLSSFLLIAAVALSSCSSSDSSSFSLPAEITDELKTGTDADQDSDTGQNTDNDLDAENPDELPRFDVRETDQLYPYRANSAYASVLKDCALVEDATLACTLETLPFIAQATPSFTREDILDRLLVTHQWMGQRFEQLLNDAPDMMVPLFGSVTSISIGSTVRPSYYWGGTGGIQLDPSGLWLNLSEKSNVATAEDYRSGFGDDLQFWFFESLRNGNASAVSYYNLVDDRVRNYEDIQIPMYRLLFHELAHAVDYLPSASIPSLDASLVPGEALFNNQNFFASPRLYNDLPLYSQTLLDLGDVSFRGATASSDQRTFRSGFLGSEMSGDGATRYYGYSTEREDFATLFAVTMMKMNFNLDYNVAFVDKPADLDNYSCDELLVGWGQKNRLADPLVIPRAHWVLQEIYGASAQIDSFFAGLSGQVEPMTAGVDWCASQLSTQLADSTAKTGPQVAVQSEAAIPTLDAQFEQLEFERRVRWH